ncbi:MAG: LysR family transcriptional regulator [Pseudomonadota bacterium]
MKLEQLRIFTAVAEYGSVRNAGTKLYKSPPSVSAAIKSLEDSVGIELFSRKGYRLELTDEGTNFLTEAKKLLESADALKRLPEKIANTNRKEYKIFCDASLSRLQVLRLADFLDSSFPELTLIFNKLHPGSDIDELFSKGFWDLAILPSSLINTNLIKIKSELNMRSFLKTNFYAACSPTYKNTSDKRKEVKLDLEKETQILFEENSYDLKSEKKAPVLSKKTISVNDMETKLSLISQGKGWGFLPRELLSNEANDNTPLTLESSELKVYSIQYYLIINDSKSLCDVSQKILESKI